MRKILILALLLFSMNVYADRKCDNIQYAAFYVMYEYQKGIGDDEIIYQLKKANLDHKQLDDETYSIALDFLKIINNLNVERNHFLEYKTLAAIDFSNSAAKYV